MKKDWGKNIFKYVTLNYLVSINNQFLQINKKYAITQHIGEKVMSRFYMEKEIQMTSQKRDPRMTSTKETNASVLQP